MKADVQNHTRQRVNRAVGIPSIVLPYVVCATELIETEKNSAGKILNRFSQGKPPPQVGDVHHADIQAADLLVTTAAQH